MDLIRYSLIGAIVMVALYLTSQWTEFQALHKPDYSDIAAVEEVPVEDFASQAPAAMSSAAEELPEARPTSTTSVSDVEESDPVAQVDQGRFVTVATDVFKFSIDRQGGDIVGVALREHLAKLDESNRPFILLEQNRRRTYIAQSGLIGANATDTAEGRPLFSSTSKQLEMAEGQDQLVVDLNHVTDNGVAITKRFTFSRGDYLVRLDYLVENRSSDPWSAILYTQLKRDSSEDPSSGTSGAGLQPFLGVATRDADKPFIKVSLDDLAEDPIKDTVSNAWIAMVQHYFLSAWVPADDRPHNVSTRVTSTGFNLINMTTPQLDLQPGQSGQLSAQFWAGPKDQYRLQEIAGGLDLTVDYGWLWWVAQPLFWILINVHKVVGNWGWSIIILTLFVKAIFYPLSAASYRSMARMRTLTPKMQQIRESYADDRQKQSQAMMDLYKKEKVNPLGGCLPILIQMPVFIALYWVLMESVELRHAPWLGWIQDLSTMDPFFILPLLMGASMFFQQKLNPPPPDPMQAKIMQWMPVFFTFFFLWFPAGLVLYWTVNNLLSMAQQWVITRQIEAAEASKN